MQSPYNSPTMLFQPVSGAIESVGSSGQTPSAPGPFEPSDDFDIFAFLRDDVPVITDINPATPQVTAPSKNGPPRLEDIVSRDAASRILNLYFSHVSRARP